MFSLSIRDRSTFARVLLALLPVESIGCSRYCELQRHADRHDWIPKDDTELLELARLASLRVELQPLPGDADD